MLGPVQSLVEPLFPLLLREGASVEEGDQLAGGAALHVPVMRLPLRRRSASVKL
jgi:hypothetical protein